MVEMPNPSKDVSSDESEEELDKITTVPVDSTTPIQSTNQNLSVEPPVDELEYQLQAEKQERANIDAGHYYTDPTDGTCYEWDEQKRAWFPRVTDDFIAAYQMSYGAVASTPSNNATPSGSTEETKATIQNPKESGQDETSQITPPEDKNPGKPESSLGKRKKKEPEWFDMEDDKNTWIYISGLPLAMSSEEFLELVGKYGLVMQEGESEKKKYKMYNDEEGNFKGDAKCCYLRKESIPLAVQMMHGIKLPGTSSKLKVERATFVMKGNFDPKLKPKKKNNNNKKKKRNKQANLLDWRERTGGNDLRPKHGKMVIMKHCFDPKEFLEDACMITEIRDDIKEECEKLGPVKKVLLFDRHPDGVVSVKFGTHEAADEAVKAFDKRWFGGKQLVAHLWDGVMDYAIEETAKERQARLDSWEKFIGVGEADEATSKSEPSENTEPSSNTAQPSLNTEPNTEPSSKAEPSKMDIPDT